jgi:formylglycine-generating enzyme required for sulfatase activity
VYVSCSDVCPDYAGAGVRYSGVDSEECACLFGDPLYGQHHFAGCRPLPDRFRYARRHSALSARTEGRRAWIEVNTIHVGERANWLGLRSRDVIEKVNGKPTTDLDALHRMLHEMPEYAPDVLTVRRGTAEVEIHYVAQERLREIEQALDAENLFDGGDSGGAWWVKTPRPGVMTLVVGARSRSWETAATDTAARSLNAAAARIARAARTFRHVLPPAAPFDCRTVRDMLHHVAIIQSDRILELDYIDWIYAGARWREAAGLPKDAAALPPETIAKDTALAKMVKMPQGFSIDRTEVTRQQYATWLDTGPPIEGQPASCKWNDDYTPSCQWPPGKKGNHPVVCVDWCDAFTYCKAVGKRLCGGIDGGPSSYMDYENDKSQWYAACTSLGAGVRYPYGDAYQATTCNGRQHPVTGCERGSCTTSEVGASRGCRTVGPGAGVYDLVGNVAELEDACQQDEGRWDLCRTRGGTYQSWGGSLQCGGVDSRYRHQSSEDVGFRCCSD